MLLFIYPEIVHVFFLFLLLPLSFSFSTPHTFFVFWLSFLLPFSFHSSISLLIVFSSLSSLVPLSLPPVPFISYTTTRLVSLPEYLQFKCHQSCFSPSGAASVYTLMMRLQTGKSRKSRVKTTPKRACSAWWQGITTALHVII